MAFPRRCAQECVPLLELARRRSLLDEAAHARLKDNLEEIAKMLTGLIAALPVCAHILIHNNG